MAAPRLDRLDKNLIINGNFDFWQRGTSASNVSAAFLADRFSYNSDAVAADLSRQTDVPVSLDPHSLYSLRVARITALAISNNQVSYIKHVLEGYDLARIRNQKITFSFWVKSTKTGTYCLTLKDDSYAGTYIKEYTISAANTWEQKIFTIELSDSFGSWNYTNSAGLRIHWMLQAGIGRRGASANTWFSLGGANTASWSTSNQVDLFDTASQNFQLARVQVVLGEFSELTFGLAGRGRTDELQLCQRYYEKSYIHDVAPGTPSTNDGERRHIVAPSLSFAPMGWTVEYKVEKRASPLVFLYSPTTGTVDRVRNHTAGADRVWYLDRTGTSSFAIGYNDVATAVNSLFGCHFVAESEL